MKFDTDKLETVFHQIDAALAHRPEALKFLVAFNEYCNRVDDIIDEADRREDPKFVIGSFLLAADIYSSSYFQQNCGLLYSVIASLSHLYAVAVKFERSDDVAKQKIADVLSLSQVSMILAVLHLECGFETTQVIAPNLVEYSYNRQRYAE